MKKFLSMAALALVGAVMTGCSSDDDSIISNPQQPENKSNVVTLTTTVGFDACAGTRALTIDGTKGVKTFAENDQIAVIYKNTSNETVKAVSEKLTDGDLINGGESANFTVTLENPAKDAAIRYIYPASMAKATVATDATIDDAGTVDFTNLNSQDGTLGTLGSTYDLCTFDAATWGGDNLPTGELKNQLAILAITLKDGKCTTGTGDDVNVTSNITGLTVSDGTNTYTVSRSTGAGPIYVAILPTSSVGIDVTATDGTNNYVKYLTSKTYEKNNGYNVSWLMTIPGDFTVGSKKVEFATSNLQATYDGSSWSWASAANPWDRIGDAAGNNKIQAIGVSENNVTVDLFGWVGASSSFTDEAQYGITSATSGYGSNATEALKYDWGTFIVGGWRTPTKDEWTYVFSTRKSGSLVNGTSDASYTHATINTDATGVNGMILFPDGVKIASDEVTTWGTINGTSAWGTKCTSAQWTALAAKGCVFLPVAGYRSGAEVINVNDGGYYWSSSPDPSSANQAYTMYFKSETLGTASPDGRKFGLSVRLVKDAE